MSSHVYLSLIIPAFNEYGTLRTTLQSADRYLTCQDYLSEIIVIDDGSRVSLVGEIVASHTPIRFIRYERNQGKGVSDHRGSNSQVIDFERVASCLIFMVKIENSEKSNT